MRYVIVFTASPDTFEDTLLFFHHDAREAFPDGAVEVLGVAAHDLGDDLSFSRCCRIGEFLEWADLERRTRPSIVHFLHLGLEHESAVHASLGARCERAGVPAVNPYNDAAQACDSKYSTWRLLRAEDVPTPETLLVSRFNRDRQTRLQQAVAAWDECYVQPDQGTEGFDTFFCDVRQPVTRSRAIAHATPIAKDFVVRKRVGNLCCAGRNAIVRVNVAHDGATFRAESGYAMLGQQVVAASHGAVREQLSRVLSAHDGAADVVCDAAARAVAAVCGRHPPPLVVGVDVAVDVRDGIRPSILDINPRPVVVGSRLIGSDRLFLGEHFWRGVFRRQARAA